MYDPLRLVRRHFGKCELSRGSKVCKAVDFGSFCVRKFRQQILTVIYQFLRFPLSNNFSCFFDSSLRTSYIFHCAMLYPASCSLGISTNWHASRGRRCSHSGHAYDLLRKRSFLFHDPACLLFFLVVNNSQNWNTQQFHAVLARFLVWFIWWIHSSCSRWAKPGSWELLARSGKLQSEWTVPVLPFHSENGQNDKMSKFHFKNADKQTVPCDFTAKEVLFEL